MKRIKKQLEEYSGTLILILSVLSFSIGFLMSLTLVVKNIFFRHTISDSEVKLIMILIAGGLLGSVFDFVLKKYLEDYVKKYIDKEKLDSIVDELTDKNITLREEEKLKSEGDEAKSNIELDTVIVPVARTFEAVKRNKTYICPANRNFKNNLEYIAFYKDKEVIGYGKLKPNNPIKNSEEQQFNFISFVELHIPHVTKGAFVQNKMYCKFSDLKDAKDTSEIRPDK